MTRLTRLCRAVGVGLAVATATLAMTHAANAAPPPPPDVPTNLVPDGASQFLSCPREGRADLQVHQDHHQDRQYLRVGVPRPPGRSGRRQRPANQARHRPHVDGRADSSSVIKNGVVNNAPSPDPGSDIPGCLSPCANTMTPLPPMIRATC